MIEDIVVLVIISSLFVFILFTIAQVREENNLFLHELENRFKDYKEDKEKLLEPINGRSKIINIYLNRVFGEEFDEVNVSTKLTWIIKVDGREVRI